MSLSYVNRYGICHCTCLKYCNGGKDVSYPTYNRHTRFREESEKAAINKFLAESGPLAGIIGIGSGSSSNGRKGKAVRIILIQCLQ